MAKSEQCVKSVGGNVALGFTQRTSEIYPATLSLLTQQNISIVFSNMISNSKVSNSVIRIC